MSRRPSLQDFVEDEMLRAPMIFDQVLDAVNEHWRLAVGPHARQSMDWGRVLQTHRADLVGAALRTLRTQVKAHQVGPGAAPPASAAPATAGSKLVLSLIDEDEVAADIEIARAVERIKSTAEFELRELQAFTSALVGDLNVSRDTNPFRPEAYVRALWEGAQGVPLPLRAQAALLHDAAEPLARALRQSYAAACARLEDQGVEPAVYRTIVVSPSARHPSDSMHAGLSTSLREMRATMPAPGAPGVPGAPVGVATLPAYHGTAVAGPRVDPQLVDLLSRLFDAIQADRSVPPACLPLLLRLQPTTLRLAVHDARMLDDYGHPVWRFMDQLAHMIGTVHIAEVERCLGFARQLVDHLVSDGAADVARFEWALGRLTAFARHSFEVALVNAEPEIAQTQAATDTSTQPLDVGTLDTVPADLLEAEQTAASGRAPTPAMSQRPGNVLRAYLQGDWRLLQLLWIDRTGETWLLRDLSDERHWALRLAAIERLFEAQLAAEVKPRSLVRNAAGRLLRALSPTPRPLS